MDTTILAIGKAGLGKSTYANIVCGRDVARTSSSGDSTTREPKLYKENGFRYLDTVGFQDTTGKPDEKVFEEIIGKMRENRHNDEFKIDLILWFASGLRASSTLQREAKFIKMFSEHYPGNDVWKSVILIAKGPIPEPNWEQGPIEAAKRDNGGVRPDIKKFVAWVLGRLDTESSCDSEKEEYDRRYANLPDVYRKDQVCEKLKELATSREPFTVRFVYRKCTKCSKEVEVRMLEGPCHTSSKLVHDEKKLISKHIGELRKFHSGGKEWYHPKTARKYGAVWKSMSAGALAGPHTAIAAGVAGLAVAAFRGPKCVSCREYVKSSDGCRVQCTYCCEDWEDEGCEEEYDCCNRKRYEQCIHKKTICEKCERDYETGGCKEICRSCEKDWGKTEGCDPNTKHVV